MGDAGPIIGVCRGGWGSRDYRLSFSRGNGTEKPGRNLVLWGTLGERGLFCMDLNPCLRTLTKLLFRMSTILDGYLLDKDKIHSSHLFGVRKQLNKFIKFR